MVVLLGGCLQQTYSDPPPSGSSGGWGTGPGGTGGDTSYGCHKDDECGGDVCARDGECMPADDVVTVHVTWTVNGQAASTDSCASTPNLDLTFFGSQGDEFGFAPVPCVEGKFTVDKLPIWYGSVQLSRSGDYGTGGGTSEFIDGTAAIDLEY